MKTERSDAEKKLGELIRQAIDESDEDLDFFKSLSKSEVPPPETFMIGQPDRPSGIWRKYALRVAGFVLAVLVCSGAFMALTKNDPVTATKKELESDGEKNGFVNETRVEENREVSKVEVYENEEDYVIAKKLIPELKFPMYIPKGYNFVSLELKIFQGDTWSSAFTYQDESKCELYIGNRYFGYGNDAIVMDGVIGSGTLSSGETVYYMIDPQNDLNIALCNIRDEEQIAVSGKLKFEELQNIIQEMCR